MDTVSGYQIAVQQEHMIIMILMTVAVVWAVKFFGELIKKEIMIFKLGKSTREKDILQRRVLISEVEWKIENLFITFFAVMFALNILYPLMDIPFLFKVPFTMHENNLACTLYRLLLYYKGGLTV